MSYIKKDFTGQLMNPVVRALEEHPTTTTTSRTKTARTTIGLVLRKSQE